MFNCLGETLLDPYASDDEDQLKALAARLEEKYGGQSSPSSSKPSKRKKQKLDDCIDRAAGYDESDSFIDNTDAYDEKIPKQLQPACGGFYINSGQLDFKEVEISEDDDNDDDDSVEDIIIKKKKVTNPAKVKLTKPDASFSPYPKSGDQIYKKRKISGDATPLGLQPKSATGANEKPKLPKTDNLTLATNDSTKKRARQISSSSSSSSETSSSSSEDSSSSSDNRNKMESQQKSKADRREPEVIILHSTKPTQKKRLDGSSFNNTAVSIKPTTLLPRKPRVKNVPLNPNLKRKDVPGALPLKPCTTLPPVTITRKILNPREFVNSKSISPATVKMKNATNINISKLSPASSSQVSSSVLQLGTKISTPSVIKVPTPKSSFSPSPTIVATLSSILSHASPIVSTPPGSTSASPLSISSELAQIFSDIPHQSNQQLQQQISNSGVTSSANSICSKNVSTPKPKHLTCNVYSEAMAKDALRIISNASSSIQQQQKKSEKRSPEFKPLPKLKHKSGFTIEKQKQQTHSPSPPPSSLANAKSVRINPKHLVTTSTSNFTANTQVSSSPHIATITSSTSQPTYNPGSVEITKLKKTMMPALGSGITVTEVRGGGGGEKSSSGPTIGMATITATTGNIMFGGKGSSNLNHNQQLNSQASNFNSNTSNIQSPTQKVSAGSSTSTLRNLTSDLSDRFNIGNFIVNKQNNKFPGFITSYDVSALLSGSKDLPDIPSSSTNTSAAEFNKCPNPSTSNNSSLNRK